MIESALLVGALFHGAGHGPSPYVDPTAGGILLQVVLGGLAGALVLVRVFWRRITSFTLRKNGNRAPQKTETKSPTDP